MCPHTRFHMVPESYRHPPIHSTHIRELHASYVVVDGFATIEVADHTWYDNVNSALDETMDVTLTPFLKSSSGRQTPLPLVSYQITIPLSPISLESPEALRTTVSTQMKAIEIKVRPGSTVLVNGKDHSDTVTAEGDMLYNAIVHPEGDNNYTFTVRSRYCRENSITVVFYREKQEIMLDLDVSTFGTTDKKTMKVSATTVAGAKVDVLTPYTDLDLSFRSGYPSAGLQGASGPWKYPGICRPSQRSGWNRCPGGR